MNSLKVKKRIVETICSVVIMIVLLVILVVNNRNYKYEIESSDNISKEIHINKTCNAYLSCNSIYCSQYNSMSSVESDDKLVTKTETTISNDMYSIKKRVEKIDELEFKITYIVNKIGVGFETNFSYKILDSFNNSQEKLIYSYSCSNIMDLNSKDIVVKLNNPVNGTNYYLDSLKLDKLSIDNGIKVRYVCENDR